jgi:hypothetical protein
MKAFLFLILIIFSLHSLSASDSEISKLADKMLEQEKNDKRAHVKFFNGLTKKSDLVLNLTLTSQEIIPIPLDSPLIYTATYPMEAGKIKVTLKKTDVPTPISEYEFELKEKDYFLGVITQRDQKYVIDPIIDNFDYNTKNTFDVHIRNFCEETPLIVTQKNSTLGTIEYGEYIDIKNSDVYPDLTIQLANIPNKPEIKVGNGYENLKSFFLYVLKDQYGYFSFHTLSRGPSPPADRDTLIQMLELNQNAQSSTEENNATPPPPSE